MDGWCRKNSEANEKGPNRKEGEYQSTKEIDEKQKTAGEETWNLQDLGRNTHERWWSSETGQSVGELDFLSTDGDRT